MHIRAIVGLPKDTQLTEDTLYWETGYEKLSDELAARALASRGYRQVSNRFHKIARCIPSILESEHLTLLELSLEMTEKDLEYDRWSDQYRRCYSKDVICEVPEQVMRNLRKLWTMVYCLLPSIQPRRIESR